MTLRLIREPSIALTTMGSLYIDDAWFCWCLEDQLREVPGQPVAQWKVPNETAIKAGRYRVILTFSHRFGRLLPELLNVDGFTAIRIHAGNRRVDSSGCILVGSFRGDTEIMQSQVALGRLMKKLVEAPQGSIELLIENPLSYRASAA